MRCLGSFENISLQSIGPYDAITSCEGTSFEYSNIGTEDNINFLQ